MIEARHRLAGQSWCPDWTAWRVTTNSWPTLSCGRRLDVDNRQVDAAGRRPGEVFLGPGRKAVAGPRRADISGPKRGCRRGAHQPGQAMATSSTARLRTLYMNADLRSNSSSEPSRQMCAAYP